MLKELADMVVSVRPAIRCRLLYPWKHVESPYV